LAISGRKACWRSDDRAYLCPASYRKGRPLYDKTLQTVLGERPCRVIVVSEQGRAGGGEVTPALA
jgi:hypothetical protein